MAGERVNAYLPAGLKDRARRVLGPEYSFAGALRLKLLEDIERAERGELVDQGDDLPQGIAV